MMKWRKNLSYTKKAPKKKTRKKEGEKRKRVKWKCATICKPNSKMAKNKRKQLNKVTKYMNYKKEKQKKKKSTKERRKKGEAVGVKLPRRELSFASCVSRIYHLQRRLWLPQQSDDSIDRAHSGVQNRARWDTPASRNRKFHRGFNFIKGIGILFIIRCCCRMADPVWFTHFDDVRRSLTPSLPELGHLLS